MSILTVQGSDGRAIDAVQPLPDSVSGSPLTSVDVTAVSDGVWGTPSDNEVDISSAGGNLPAIAAGQVFRVEDHSNDANNGLYVETGGSPTTSAVTATKIDGVPPEAATSEAVSVLPKAAGASSGVQSGVIILSSAAVYYIRVSKNTNDVPKNSDMVIPANMIFRVPLDNDIVHIRGAGGSAIVYAAMARENSV